MAPSYTPRKKLPVLEGTVPASQALPSGPSPVCSHTALPLFDLSSVKAELAASKAPKEAVPCWLPPHIGETVTSWARPLEALPLSTATEDQLAARSSQLEAEAKVTPEGAESSGQEKVWQEYEVDVATKKVLPRMFLPEAAAPAVAEKEEAPFAWPAERALVRGFVRFWTAEQRKQAELDQVLATSNLPTSHDKAVAEARRKGVEPPPPPKPEGPYRDELMAGVFNAVAQLRPLLDTSPKHNQPLAPTLGGKGKSKKGGSSRNNNGWPFLWEGIYPQQADGRPCFNPSGVYVVRLWCSGAWRAVTVDDCLPLNSKGECVLPATTDDSGGGADKDKEKEGAGGGTGDGDDKVVFELWPLILAKALYKVLETSGMGARSGDTFSLKYQPKAYGKQHENLSSLATGGVFGLLTSALTGWHLDSPKTLSTLATMASPEPNPTTPTGMATLPPTPSSATSAPRANPSSSSSSSAAAPDQDNATNQEPPMSPSARSESRNSVATTTAPAAASALPPPDVVSVAEAARALVRHLVSDGLPCAPLEQFKYDEVYRATVAAALGKDPFLVSTSASKWPQPPEKRRANHGKKKKKNGGELLQSIKTAGSVREQRVAELKQKLFDPTKRTRVFALCATEAPPPPPPPSRRESRRSSSLRTVVRRVSSFGVSRGNTPESPTGVTSPSSAPPTPTATVSMLAINALEGESTVSNAPNAPSSPFTAGAATTGGELLLGGQEGVEEEGEGESMTTEGETMSMDATSLTGSMEHFDEFGNPLNRLPTDDQDAEDEGDESAEENAFDNEPLSPNASSAHHLLSASSAAPSFRSSAHLRRSTSAAAANASESVPLYPVTRVMSHIVLAVGLRASSLPLAVTDAKDIGEFGGNGASKVSDRRMGWLRNEDAAALQQIKQQQQQQQQAGDGGESVASHASAVSAVDVEPPEPKLLVLWRDPKQLPAITDDDDEMPHFSPDHPAKSKGNLRWITPSNFITAMGGPTQVSLVTLSTRNGMVPQPPPPAHNHSALTLVNPPASVGSASTLLTLRHHWKPATTSDDPNNKQQLVPNSTMEPTLLRIITPTEKESEMLAAAEGSVDGASSSSSSSSIAVGDDLADDPAARMIRLLISVEADPFAPPAPPTPLLGGGGDAESAGLFPSEGAEPLSPARWPGINKAAANDMGEHEQQQPVSASGCVFIKPVPFIAPDPTEDEDEDEEEQDGDAARMFGGGNQLLLADGTPADSFLPPGWNRTVAWVTDWRRPPEPTMTALSLMRDSEDNLDGDLDSQANVKQWRPPSGNYQHPVDGMPDGTVRIVVAPSPAFGVGNKSPPLSSAPSLPFAFSTTEVLLPLIPRAKRTDPRRSTDAKPFSRDYFLELHLDLPSGGLVHLACSEKVVLGPATEVWGAGLAIKSKQHQKQEQQQQQQEQAAAAAAAEEAVRTTTEDNNADQDDEDDDEDGEDSDAASLTSSVAGGEGSVAAAPTTKKKHSSKVKGAWKHARQASGFYPALPATVAPSMQSARDRRGRGDYDQNHESWAVLFRFTVKVLPEVQKRAPTRKRRASLTPSGGEGGGEQEASSVSAAASSTLIDDVMQVSSDVGCRFKLHLSDPKVRRFVRLITIAPNPADGRPQPTSHPLLDTPPLRWRPNNQSNASSSVYVVMAVLEKPPHVELDAGSWSLACLADGPVSPLTSVEAAETDSEGKESKANMTAALVKFDRLNSTAKLQQQLNNTTAAAAAAADLNNDGGGVVVSQRENVVWRIPNGPMARAHRWGGVYRPNNALKLLDDVLTTTGSGSSSSSSSSSSGGCKVSLRFEVYPQTKSPVASYALRLRVFQKVVATSKKQQQNHQQEHGGLGHGFDGVKIPPLQVRSGYEMVEERRGMDHVQVELITLPNSSGLLFELTLDEKRMEVAGVLRSRKPYYTTIEDQLTAQAKTAQSAMSPHDSAEEGQGGSNSSSSSSSAMTTTTWACPQWRVIALPSTPAALTLTPDSTTHEWMNKVQSKWADLRSSAQGEVLGDPFWLKANDALMDERRASDAAARNRFKQYQDSLTKGKRGKKPPTATAVGGSGARAGEHHQDSNRPLPPQPNGGGAWFRGEQAVANLPVLPASVVVDRTLESGEKNLMFSEDDRHAAKTLEEQLAAGMSLIEEQKTETAAMQAGTATIASEWAAKRETYRKGAAARFEAAVSLFEVGKQGLALPEGEKGAGISTGANAKDKGKKGKK